MIAVPGYRVGRRIGAGGVGEVFAATDEATGRAVALKILNAAPDDAEAAARLEREARAANATAHPGIVPVLASGRLGDGRRYLVLPLLTGRTLREEMDARGPLPPAEAWEIARHVASALGAAHAVGIIHRDVKPENVFLEEGGRIRLLDFGLAKRTEDAEVSRLTKTGAVLGTPAYMAPEQWWSSPVDERTDQYALGAMFFEMVAGRPPFEGGSFAELLQKHLHEPVPPLSVSPELDAFVGRLLRKEKADRFASTADVVREGDRAFGRAAEPAEPRHGRASATIAGVVTLGLALLWGVGYAGDIRRNVAAWFLEGGLVLQVVTTVLAVAAALALLRVPRAPGPAPRALAWLALGPAFVGIAVTYIGWSSVMRSVASAPLLHRIDILHEGLFEANLCRFWGFGLAAIVLAAFASLRAGSRHPAQVLERRVATLVAAALVAAVALSRLEAREAAAWASDAMRVDRAREIVDAAAERRVTVGTVVVLLTGSVGFLGQRIWRDRSVLRIRRSATALVVAAFVAAGANAWLDVRIGAARATVRAALAPQFALFAKLDPPSVTDHAHPEPPPDPATALQVSSVMLAIDGVPVAPLAALESAPGGAHVGEEIDRALAKAAARGATATRVALMVDRDVAFGVVRRLLARARASGVETADVFLTRGPSPEVPAGAPAEAALVKASDFVTRVMVLADDGERFSDDAPFRDVARRLELAGGPTRVAVAR